MEYTELQKYGDYSVILRHNGRGYPITCEPFVVVCKPNIQNGAVINWWYGHYFQSLTDAVDYARSRGTKQLHYNRLEEIASKLIDGLIENDEDSAYEYFAREIEIDEHEAEYFGLDKSKFYE